MSTGFTPEEDEILAKWLCAGCYGKYFLAGFFNGSTVKLDTSASRNTTVTLAFVGENGHRFEVQNPIVKRNYTKTTHWNNAWFDPHGIIFDGPRDTNYASYWGDLAGGQRCWGERESEFNGSYAVSSDYHNSQIYFADLREDILVYYHEEGNQSASQSGSNPMGVQLAYAYWNGADEAGCRTVDIKDAIKLPISLSPHMTKKELITLGNYQPFSGQQASTNTTFNVAASDYFASINDFAVIDQNKPYDCNEGVYTDLIVRERLDGYSNTWDAFGTFRAIDLYDISVWNASFNEQGINHLPDGVHDCPSFIEIDPMPRGSWAVDAAGNYFYSMITKDFNVFNKLNTADPNSVTQLPGNGIVFYPVAPA